MKLRFLLPCFIGLATFTALANGDITGKVLNKATGEPMDFVNVQLINAKTGKPLPIGTNTDENGNFSRTPEGMPVQPKFGGYNQEYFDNIVRTTGDHFKVVEVK